MAEQINFSLLLSETAIAELNPKWAPAMVSDYASISRTFNQFLNLLPTKGMIFTFTGNGSTAPVLSTDYNIKTFIRQSQGVYRATYKDSVINGGSIETDYVYSTGYHFVDNLMHSVEITKGAGFFDVSTFTLAAGSKIAYDISTGDEISISIFINREAVTSV